ncbi:LamG-like jellyroll fold domain-containing protein [Embleya sp. NPDC020630]|uniref:LamG-like jellyroll fold domain-containing protein n=1 Tax=Embleya sp. NPDC020630 TaxID=3363979 RepID=UPI00379C0B79
MRVYRDRRYLSTTMVRHGGTTVAFAMDDQRRICYTVLDLEQASAKRGPLDAKYWNEEPAPVPFPGELADVAAPGATAAGVGSPGPLQMPIVRKGSRTESVGKLVPPDERDPFLSTTARLSAAQPFQVLSDGRYIILFRQSVEASHEDAAGSASAGTGTTPAGLVDRSLLCDRFVLVGAVLKPVVEVRYQRSRSKAGGASESDTLGTRDMEGNPFYEPTSKLSFVGPVRDGQFAAVLIPTAVAGKFRWQLFATNAAGGVEGYNCAQREDGLFDVTGAELYTSPDPRFVGSVLERAPGMCPFTKRPLVLTTAAGDRAGTALRFEAAKGTHVRVPALPAAGGAAAPAGFTVEAWVKPAAASGTIVAQPAMGSPTGGFVLELDADRRPAAEFRGVRVVSGTQVPLGVHMHVAAVFDGRNAVLYVDGDKVGGVAATVVPSAGWATTLGARLVADAPEAGFVGDIDEVRLWDRARQAPEFADRGRRLPGIEPGLAAYYRFDEGIGAVVGDHTRARRDAEARNTPEWVASGAPVGDGPGLARDVFRVAGRKASTGLAATLYSQQEPAISGYGTTVTQEKSQTRLLLAYGTTGPAPAGGDASRSYVATVDFGVTRDGRLASAPASLTLPERGSTASVGDPAEIADAEANVARTQAVMAPYRALAAQIPQILAEFAALNASPSPGRTTWDFGDPRDVKLFGLEERLRAARAAQHLLGTFQAVLEAAEDRLATVSGGTRGGGDTVVDMPLVSTDRQGLTVFGALLAFAWTDQAPFLLDSSTGDVVMYFRGGAGQFFSAYYSTLVSRATRSTAIGSGSVQFVARDTGTRMRDFAVRVTADSAADLCTVTVTRGLRTETFRGVPRAAASFAAVLNGNLPPGAVLGTVRSVKDRLVELAAPTTIPLAVGSRVAVGGRIRTLEAAVPAGATTFGVIGATVTAAPGTQVTAVLYDYTDATCTVPGVDLSRGSQIVAVNRLGTTAAVPDGTAADLADGVGPHWRGHAPGRAPSFDGDFQSLSASSTANFATDADLTLEAWVDPGIGAGRNLRRPVANAMVAYTVLHATPAGTPRYGMNLMTGHLYQSLQLGGDIRVDCGDRLRLGGRDFTVEMWVRPDGTDACHVFTNGSPIHGGKGTTLTLGFADGNRFGVGVHGPNPMVAATTVRAAVGTWEHWCVVHKNSTGEFLVYRNGTAQPLVDPNSNNPLAPMRHTGPDGKTVIGAEVGVNPSTFGIDEVRVWDSARTPAQITANMRRRLRGHESGLLAYWQFDDRLTVDRSGNGHDGKLQGPYRSAQSPLLGYRPVATVGDQEFRTQAATPFGDWTHVAFAFKQHWAMSMDGGHLDAGGPDGLNLTGDLTIEAGVYLDRLGVVHGLVGKGALGGGRAGTAVPYALYVEPDGRVAFAFESGAGEKGVTILRSTIPMKAKTVTRVAVTRKNDGKGNATITIHVSDGSLTAPAVHTFDGAPPVGNDENCEVGRIRRGRESAGLRGCLTYARIWNIVREDKQIGAPTGADTPGLLAWWNFPEKDGPVTADACRAYPAKLCGPRRILTPDPKGNQATFYIDGAAESAEVVPALADDPPSAGRPRATVAAEAQGASATTGDFAGVLDEVRVWRTCRTREQVLDNMFGRLRGEQNDLIAYYPFDGASTMPGANVKDAGPRGNDLTPGSTPPRNVISSAPISADTAEVRSALTGIVSTFNTAIDTMPAVSEYGDLQADSNGHPFGVMKRAYAYIRNHRWHLRTGYKIGALTTTWVGQAQFDPQLVGFLEGAPPMPSENMVWGTAATYADKAAVSFVQADSVTNTLSQNEKRSLEASAKATIEVWAKDKTNVVAAPLGVGTAKPALEVKFGLTVEAEIKFANSWSTNLQVSQSTATTRTSKVTLNGQWEEDAASGQVNPAVGRRWVPANTGFAIVQSATADVYALRLAHSGVLVAYRMLPNADIPLDWNIIDFPINSRYTKQGTLDGFVGYAPKAASGAMQPFPDPVFPHAGDGGECSYYRPREAYAIKRRIQREEQQLQSFYESVSTDSSTFAARNPVQAQAERVLGGMLGAHGGSGLGTGAADPEVARRSAQVAARRHMANTYVWTAAGGLFSETTSTTDQVTQVTTGEYSVSSSVKHGGFGNFEMGPSGVNLSGSATLGGGYTVTRSKTKGDSLTFRLDVSADPGRILQKQENGKPVFDIDGKPVLVPGRVDAYRFITFYLDSSADNFEDFYGKVVDPDWLDRDTGAAARALRQTRQSDRKPPCWRVLHRVTFVSRVHDTTTATPSLARALGSLGITSDYHLMKQLEPYLTRSTGSAPALTAATKATIAARFPTLVPYTDTITARVAAYYNLDAPAPVPAAPAPTSTLKTANPTVAAGNELALDYATPAATATPKNWIGLYGPGTGPANGDAADWTYAPGTAGTLRFTAGRKLPAGTYTAWYLHDDGYTPLAGPVTVTFR